VRATRGSDGARAKDEGRGVSALGADANDSASSIEAKDGTADETEAHRIAAHAAGRLTGRGLPADLGSSSAHLLRGVAAESSEHPNRSKPHRSLENSPDRSPEHRHHPRQPSVAIREDEALEKSAGDAKSSGDLETAISAAAAAAARPEPARMSVDSGSGPSRQAVHADAGPGRFGREQYHVHDIGPRPRSDSGADAGHTDFSVVVAGSESGQE